MNVAKPLFKRVDHCSITVADLDAAITFYTDVMGGTLSYRMGPFDAAEIPPMEDGRDWSEAHVNVKDARIKLAKLQLTENLGLELLEYERPTDAGNTPPRNCDVGGHHICLEVEDIAATIAYLEQRGCRAMSGPITIEDGPCPPSKSWYIADPFGNQLELVEYL